VGDFFKNFVAFSEKLNFKRKFSKLCPFCVKK
jgi:hypothetical protein